MDTSLLALEIESMSQVLCFLGPGKGREISSILKPPVRDTTLKASSV